MSLFYGLDLLHKEGLKLEELVPFGQSVGISVEGSGNFTLVDQCKFALLREQARQFVPVCLEFFFERCHLKASLGHTVKYVRSLWSNSSPAVKTLIP